MTTDPKDFYKRLTLPGTDAEEPDSKEKTPQKIGPYKVESLLERGGMSYVYLGTHPESKEPVTIKVLSPKYLKHPEVVDHFLREAEMVAIADHPNIVKLYGHGKWDGGLYIALEFIEGISLRQYIQHHPMSLKTSLELVLEIAYALCHLHTHGMIHRDLKLENILMTEEGTIKLIDFGIAQLLTEKSEGTEVPKQQIIGTPIYMSPEQRKDPSSVSFPSDIYSLGIISYELILGKLSHGRVHLSLVPKGLQKILAKSLQPEPEHRYQDVVDFITDISTYLHSATLSEEISGQSQWQELIEKLQQAEQSLTPKATPNWPKFDIYFGKYKGPQKASVYHDFLNLPQDHRGIILAAATHPGAQGIVYTSVLHGMLRALSTQEKNIQSLFQTLNTLIAQDPINEVFALNVLTISPHSHEFHYLCCGEGSVWHLPKGETSPHQIALHQKALGEESKQPLQIVTETWSSGDTLILTSFTPTAVEEGPSPFPPSEAKWKEIVEQTANLSPKVFADTLLRKLKQISAPQPLTSSLAVLCVTFTPFK